MLLPCLPVLYCSRSASTTAFPGVAQSNSNPTGLDPSLKPINPTPKELLAIELGRAAQVLHATAMLTENDALKALQICEDLATALIGEPGDISATSFARRIGPTLNLLSLAEKGAQAPPTKVSPAITIEQQTTDKISSLAFQIVNDPKVFITPKLLAKYVSTQIILRQPKSFPKIFDLYASKPIPIQDSSPLKYKASNPESANVAIPFLLARAALIAAIDAKDLALCLNIITTTVCATAYKRAKFVRKALFPSVAFALSPAAAYLLSSKLAQYQDTMDVQLAANLGTAGILAYLGFTATLGCVAITTSNDQMDRITWARGTPLRERWTREDERALIDRVAGAWGFQSVEKKGEEEGSDWEKLRTWVMQRGMILDDPGLMEGME